MAVEVQHIRVFGERHPLVARPRLQTYEPIKEGYGQDCSGNDRSPSKGIDNNCALGFFHVCSFDIVGGTFKPAPQRMIAAVTKLT